jgi:hypothetical protein
MTKTDLVQLICPAPQTPCITRRAWRGYSLSMRTAAALWKAPNMGRS